MPKVAAVRNFTLRFSKLKVHPKHDEGCPVQDPKDAYDKRCKCERSAIFNPGYVVLNTHKRSAQAATDWANQYAKDSDPTNSSAWTPKPILEAFDEIIFEFAEKTRGGTKKKMVTVRNSVKTFMNEWNAKHAAADQLTNIHELTQDALKRLVRIWDRDMPTKTVHTSECDRRKSCNCPEVKPEMTKNEKRNRIGFLVRFFEAVIQKKWMEDSGRVKVLRQPGKQIVINESNPAAYLEVTGADSLAEQKTGISEEMFKFYMFELERYSALRDCKHTDPNLVSRAATYFRFMKRAGLSKTDGYTCRKDSLKKDKDGWYVSVRRLKTDELAEVRITDQFYAELMNVPSGMEPTHADFIFWSGFDFEKAKIDATIAAREAVQKNPELSQDKAYEKAYADALNEQQTNAADTFEKLWATLTDRILATEAGRKLMYEECNVDPKMGLIPPTIHCFRYGYNGKYREMSRTLGFGDGDAGAAKSLGHTKAVAEKHYKKVTPKEQAEIIAVQKRLAEEEEAAEALSIHQFVEMSVKQ